MNSKITGVTPVVESQYPVLKKTSEPLCGWEYVVLFTSYRTGMIVHVITEGQHDAPPRNFKVAVGYYSDGFGEDSFVKFDGTIELSN